MRKGALTASVLVALVAQTAVAQTNRAIAKIRGAGDFSSGVSGTVVFEQAANNPRADVTVTVRIRGLRPGQHGFHVHQNGDVRETTDLSTMAAHFVPFCVPPEVEVNPDGTVQNATNGCKNDQIHGLPPSVQRQPGDMGNILVAADGSVTQSLTIGQGKMSLTDSMRSIVGRTVLVHSERDDGSQPYGNAGVPEAYGVIGLASTAALNNAQAPQLPPVTKVICTFERPDSASPSGASAILGSALLTRLEPHRPGTVRMQARLQGLKRDSTHSFHFHKWGDMTVGWTTTELGEIYVENAIVVDSVHVNSQGFGLFDHEFSSPTLLQHVGRSLTIHEGASADTPTIAAAVCGLAHPHAKVDTEGANHSALGVSAGVVVLLVLLGLVSFGCMLVAALYFFRLPIPCCGKYIYSRGERKFSSVPPPPPQPPPPPGAPALKVESI